MTNQLLHNKITVVFSWNQGTHINDRSLAIMTEYLRKYRFEDKFKVKQDFSNGELCGLEGNIDGIVENESDLNVWVKDFENLVKQMPEMYSVSIAFIPFMNAFELARSWVFSYDNGLEDVSYPSFSS